MRTYLLSVLVASAFFLTVVRAVSPPLPTAFDPIPVPVFEEEETIRPQIPQTPRIVGGTNAEIGEFPFVAYFETLVSRNAVAVCGGALISASYVITAAHCCVNPTTGTDEDVAIKKDAVVHIGGYKLSSMRNGINGGSAGGERRVVEKTIVPGSHRRATNFNDICLVKLQTKASQAVRIKLNFDSSVPALPGTATAIGWGTTSSNNTQPDILQKVSVPYVSNTECDSLYGGGNQIVSSMLCAGDIISGGKDTCQGDSGGPLFTGSGDSATLMGLTSFGAGCGDPAFPGVYTRVSSFKDFICKSTQSEPFDCPGGTDTGSYVPSGAATTKQCFWLSFIYAWFHEFC